MRSLAMGFLALAGLVACGSEPSTPQAVENAGQCLKQSNGQVDIPATVGCINQWSEQRLAATAATLEKSVRMGATPFGRRLDSIYRVEMCGPHHFRSSGPS